MRLVRKTHRAKLACLPNVVIPDGRLIRDLNAGQFVGQAKHEPVNIAAATQDSGPRRILLVLETGRQLPREFASQSTTSWPTCSPKPALKIPLVC